MDERKTLALYCSRHPEDNQAFERLCMSIRPIAFGVMKLHKNVIPYYDRDDYLQEAYITLYRVLMRISANPDIADSFSAYLWVSIKNAYCRLFREYVLHHLVEVRSHEMREGNLTCSYLVYFQEYADEYYRKKRESRKEYYCKNRDRILAKQRQKYHERKNSSPP